MPSIVPPKGTARVAMLACALVWLSRTTEAQTKQAVDASQPMCKSCSLTFTKMATLGSANDPVLPGVGMRGSGLAMNSKGQFIVTSLGSDQVVVYDRSGTFVQAIGRKGEGPGEFRQARHILVDRNDTVFVLDVGRISVFAPTFKYVRTITIFADPPKDIKLLPKNAILVNYGGRYRSGPLQLALDTRKQKPFPNDTTAYGPCSYVYCNLAIGIGGGPDRMWSSWSTVYNLLEWDSNGVLLRNVDVRGSPWHKVSNLPEKPSRDVRPAPVVVALGEDDGKQLWVLGETTPSDWQPFAPLPSVNAGRSGSNVAIGAAFAGPETLKRLVTVVDIFDLTSNRLLMSQTLPNRKLLMMAPGLFAEVREDKNDIPVWDIFRITIRKP